MQKLIYKSERQRIYEQWLTSLSSAVATAMRDYLPEVADCYRIVGDGEGHYFLDQVVEPISPFPVTCNLLHGKSSSDPGTFVTGVPFEAIIPCDCGTLEFPSTYETRIRVYLDVPSNIWTRHDLRGPLRRRRHLPPAERT